MDRLKAFWRGSITAMIKELENDNAYIEADLAFYPIDSFGYAWRKLAIEFGQLKIELWKALL